MQKKKIGLQNSKFDKKKEYISHFLRTWHTPKSQKWREKREKMGKGKCAQDIDEQEMLRIVGLLKLGGLSHAV